jgi:hypothetical protein
VAVVAWIVLARPGRRRAATVIAAVVGGLAAAMIVGPHVAAGQGALLDKAAQTLFPGLPHGRALIIGFTLLQAVHYAMWLVYMPRRWPLATFHVYLELVVLGARLARRPR